MDKPKSPPAFPQNTELFLSERECGMSLRDWFAGQALVGMCANTSMFDGCGGTSQVEAQRAWLTQCAFEVADAMLDERERTQ